MVKEALRLVHQRTAMTVLGFRSTKGRSLVARGHQQKDEGRHVKTDDFLGGDASLGGPRAKLD